MERKSKWKAVVQLILYLAAVGILTFLVIRFVGQRTQVTGASMEPALSDGDNLIVDKISYRMGEPERFDIIVFPYRQEEDTYFIKRIIGMPGETVRIDAEGLIYINGERLRESYGKEVMKNPGIAETELIIGADEYFVLGDNRNDSLDSREEKVGLIERENIIGKAWIRIYPFDKIGSVRHQ